MSLTASPSTSQLLADDMQAVDALIGLRLQSQVALVSQVSQYIVAAGGKRLRPVILLLMSRALGVASEQRINLAAVVEFIHTATLLHDDVVDESELRRGRATANNAFGNAASVLVGDFLYSRAFQMMVSSNNVRIMQVLADATNIIAEGEVMQLMNVHDAQLSVEQYLQVIRSKTAKLFEASSRLAAVLAGSDAATEEACAQYGNAVGTAFQIIDDVLDYDGAVDTIGKNVGDDLREGKATLPLIFAMQLAAPEDAAIIRHAIETGGLDQLERISALVKSSGALQKARALAQAEAELAQQALAVLPNNEFKTALLQLAADASARMA